MKATEFRIGNLVYYHIVDSLDERKEWDEISEIDAEDLVLLSKNKDDDFNPIPITTETIQNLRIGYKNKTFICAHVGCGLMLTFTKKGIFLQVYGFKQKIRVEFIHQLQNIVFALTGKEIEKF